MGDLMDLEAFTIDSSGLQPVLMCDECGREVYALPGGLVSIADLLRAALAHQHTPRLRDLMRS